MPYIKKLRVKNYRVLKDLALDDLQPLNVVLGPNGCGKSTLFDVFGFLSDSLQTNVRKALEPRGRFRELRSRGASEPIEFEMQYRESDFLFNKRALSPLITYILSIDSVKDKPEITQEILMWKQKKLSGEPFRFLDMKNGVGQVITGKDPENDDEKIDVDLDGSDILAVKALGRFAENPRIASLSRFIEGWFLSNFVPEQARRIPEAGAKEHLSRGGEHLPNVIRYLAEDKPEILEQILERATQKIPGLERVDSKRTEDGRFVLRFKDGPFNDPFLAKFVSDGTIKMLAYFVLLMDPDPPPLLCIEEPENGLHPRLLDILVEELRSHSVKTQVFVSTYSPRLVNWLRPEELWIMDRDPDTGYATIERADKIQGILDFVREGAALGDLWTEDQFRRSKP